MSFFKKMFASKQESDRLPRNLRSLVESFRKEDKNFRLGSIEHPEEGPEPLPAAITLGKIAKPSDLPALLGYLSDSSPSVREGVAEALGELGDSSLAPQLINLLDDPNSSVQYAAVRSLGKIRNPISIDSLSNILQESTNDTKVNLAARALGHIGDTSVIKVLIAALVKHSRQTMILARGTAIKVEKIEKVTLPGIVDALVELNAKEAIPALKSILHPTLTNDLTRLVETAISRLEHN